MFPFQLSLKRGASFFAVFLAVPLLGSIAVTGTATAAQISPQAYKLVGCAYTDGNAIALCLSQNESDLDQFTGSFANGTDVAIENDGIFFYAETMGQLKNCGKASTPAHGISSCSATGDSAHVFVTDSFTYDGQGYSLTTPTSS